MRLPEHNANIVDQSLNTIAILTQEPTPEAGLAQEEKALFKIDPLSDSRWETFLSRHPEASVFHSRPWLEALRRTYGYEALSYSTSAPGEPLRDSLLFCQVQNWLTGRRLVSLPFSDHCQPLVQNPNDVGDLVERVAKHTSAENWRYVEFRPKGALGSQARSWYLSTSYKLHRVNLKGNLDAIFSRFHKSSIQRKIKRAERESVRCESGTSDSLLDIFYRLLTVTRRRHGVPPQPKTWFRNLRDCFGPALQISVASKNGTPLAAMLTLRHKNTLVYKYGGSDTRFHYLGGVHTLYWEAIQRAKSLGLGEFDLGRCDVDQEGLITFKRRWAADETDLTYYRIAGPEQALHVFDVSAGRSRWKVRAAKTVFSHTPNWVLPGLGRILYKHIG